jgi:hypothetical protein
MLQIVATIIFHYFITAGPPPLQDTSAVRPCMPHKLASHVPQLRQIHGLDSCQKNANIYSYFSFQFICEMEYFFICLCVAYLYNSTKAMRVI